MLRRPFVGQFRRQLAGFGRVSRRLVAVAVQRSFAWMV